VYVMRYRLIYLAELLVLGGGLAAQGQIQSGGTTPAKTPTIRTTAQEVVLDIVFRDKKGKSVRDVRPEEIHIFEEGVEQKLNSLRMVEGMPRTTGAAPATGAGAGAGQASPMALDPMREIRLVTLVFENLEPDAKRFFRQAAKDILDMAPEQNLYFSVFTVDQKLHCLQPFTQDHQALLKTLDRAAMWSFIEYSTQSADVKAKLSQVVSNDMPSLTSSGTSGPSSAQIGSMVNWMLAKIQYDTLQQADAVDRQIAARASLTALQALVREQAKLPGRKVVLYFNSWFVVDASVQEMYANLLDAARLGNITFYTVDAKGLVVYSQGAGGRSQLNDANAETRRAMQSHGAGEVTIGQARAADNAEAGLRANPLMWMRDLAAKTGGSAIAETNDWKAPLRVVMDEVRRYFEASYTPQVTSYDGQFRKIVVKIDRPDVAVFTRSGYYALPVLSGGRQLAAFEMPLLNAMNALDAPADVGFRAAAQRFNDRGPKVEYMLTVEAPLRGLVFEAHPERKSASVDAALLVAVKDEHGEIVDKFSKEFSVQVDLDKVEGYKGGNLVQTFRTELQPGSYTMESVVMDRKGNKTGVTKSALRVPQPSSKLSLSDIVVVRRADALKDNQILDAFYYEGGKIVPTLTGTLKGGPGNILSFYFAVYPDRSVAEAPKLTMSFYMGGQFLGSAEAPLPPPQKDGRIPYIASLPADKFAPGSYEIGIGITQGAAKAEEKIAFKVE